MRIEEFIRLMGLMSFGDGCSALYAGLGMSRMSDFCTDVGVEGSELLRRCWDNNSR